MKEWELDKGFDPKRRKKSEAIAPVEKIIDPGKIRTGKISLIIGKISLIIGKISFNYWKINTGQN